VDKQDKRIRASVIEQPLEGLLYDLDLLPEQCRNATANMRRITVEELRKEIELYKRTVEHDTKEIKLLTAEIDQKDEEIERLRESFVEIRDLAIATPDDNDIDRLNEAINDIMTIAQQALKEE